MRTHKRKLPVLATVYFPSYDQENGWATLQGPMRWMAKHEWFSTNLNVAGFHEGTAATAPWDDVPTVRQPATAMTLTVFDIESHNLFLP